MAKNVLRKHLEMTPVSCMLCRCSFLTVDFPTLNTTVGRRDFAPSVTFDFNPSERSSVDATSRA